MNMFGKLLCKLDFHDMRLTLDDWEFQEQHGDPLAIVTRWEIVYTCSRCGKEDRHLFVYDPERTYDDYADEVRDALRL